jgi:hypothetical protein
MHSLHPNHARSHARCALGTLSALGAALLAAAPATAQDLFVTNQSTNTVSRFAATGPGTYATVGTTLSGGLNFPQGLAFDPQGDLFVTNIGNGTVTEFASTGPGTFGAAKTVATDLIAPISLAFGAGGTLFAANAGSTTGVGAGIVTFAPTATGFGPATAFGTVADFPVDLAFDPYGDLFVSGGYNKGINVGVITEFASTGVGTFGPATTFSTLKNLQGLAFDSRGDLFATNPQTNAILEFASTGTGTFGPAQTVETGLGVPAFLAFAPAAVPEAATTVSFGLLLAFGLGGVVVAARRKRQA